MWVAFGYLTQAIGLQDTQVSRLLTHKPQNVRPDTNPNPPIPTPFSNQTLTQASKSAFICSLSVVVVPIVNAIVYKKRPPPATWLASILAVIGVGMLTLEGTSH